MWIYPLIYAPIFFLVSLLWVWYFSRYAPELRIKTLVAVFFAGAAGAILSIPVERSFFPLLQLRENTDASPLTNFLLFFFVVGPVEEVLKFLAAFFAGLRRSDFKSSAGGVILAVTAALGFAGAENVNYLLMYGLDTIPRLILSNLGHASYAVLWGYALGVTLHENAPLSLLPVSLGLASLLHGAYDFCLSLDTPGLILAGLLCVLSFAALFALVRSERRRSVSRATGAIARAPGPRAINRMNQPKKSQSRP